MWVVVVGGGVCEQMFILIPLLLLILPLLSFLRANKLWPTTSMGLTSRRVASSSSSSGWVDITFPNLTLFVLSVSLGKFSDTIYLVTTPSDIYMSMG